MTMKIKIAFTIAICLLLIGVSLAQKPAAVSVPPEGSQFDFLIGTWNLQVQPNIPNVPPKVSGKWTAQKSADGYMIVDEYRLFDDAGNTAYLGETYRVYNPQSKEWEFRYVEPLSWYLARGNWPVGERRNASAAEDCAPGRQRVPAEDPVLQHFR
jgi:hypothetical protein